jgi:hypothetical protein
MMLEWILVGIIGATAIVMIALTIDEAVFNAMPRHVWSRRFPNAEEQPASRVQHDNADEARKRAA